MYEELDGEECQIFVTGYFTYIIIVSTAVNEKKHEKRERNRVHKNTNTRARAHTDY